MRDPLGIVGTTIDRRYAVRRFVAEGGFGIVYEAEATALGVKVAIKVLRSEILASSTLGAEARTRFEQEARVLAKLRHPGIVSITDASHLDDGTPYLALEWIEGETLDTYLNRVGALPLDDALAMIAPVARAIQHAHEQQIIHRDLKPSNVMITNGAAKVLDFGLARWASPEGLRTSTQAGTGLSIGFAAPEQYGKEFGPVDARADQFALAAVIYATLTAKPPFAGERLTEVMWATCMAPLRPSVRNDRPELSQAVDDVLQRALSIRSEARYSTTREFFAALEDAARSHDGVPATFKQGPPTQTAGTMPQVATLPSPELGMQGPRTRVESAFVVAPTMPAMTGPAGTKPTGHSPPPRSEPISAVPSTRASLATTWTIVLAVGAAIGAGTFAAWPLIAPSPPRIVPKVQPSASPSVSTSASAAPGPCGVLSESEACISGTKFRRGPEDCSGALDREHRLACPPAVVSVPMFVIDRYEVSFARYAKCTKCPKLAGEPGFPVRNITRANAAAFCAFEKKRLPSDDEWELAAAGKHNQKHPWGNEAPTPTRAQFTTDEASQSGPLPVDTLQAGATPDGVFHLVGNVAEWTSTDAPADAPWPFGQTALEFATRAWVRGGSYESTAESLRSWSREAYPYDHAHPTIGFRCARTPK